MSIVITVETDLKKLPKKDLDDWVTEFAKPYGNSGTCEQYRLWNTVARYCNGLELGHIAETATGAGYRWKERSEAK